MPICFYFYNRLALLRWCAGAASGVLTGVSATRPSKKAMRLSAARSAIASATTGRSLSSRNSARVCCARPSACCIGSISIVAGNPRRFDGQIEVRQDAADLGELGRSGKGGGAHGADQLVEKLAVLVDGQLKLLHGVALLSQRMGRRVD